MFNQKIILKDLQELLEIHSPSGYTNNVIEVLKSKIDALGYQTTLNPKGNLIVSVSGSNPTITRGLSAHVDTLGLMVRSINADGTLALTTLGGPLTPTLDGEYCDIITRTQKSYTGTILSTSPSIHVFKDASSKKRGIDDLIVRIDEDVTSKEDVLNLGINNGDIVAYDPKFFVSDSGYIKSRFLDDKASVAILLHILKTLKQENITPSTNLKFIFTTYEEVGHGAAHIPEDISEFLAVDMGAMGADLSCTEKDVSICAKDSSGPYDYHLTTNLINTAKKLDLNYAVDIYPMYGSDASAALRGGANIKAGLIGPGVAHSHGMERTHIKGLENTFKLILAYINP
ncbi:MAG TPA: M42 family metallopeptidase [Erysipelothrix sp.]|nr:M42 family metallopeptidase [Erysipelothrix sp.]